MTAQQELTLLETAYTNWIAAGCPEQYYISGRGKTYASAVWFSKRMDQLRGMVARETSGSFLLSQFRDAE